MIFSFNRNPPVKKTTLATGKSAEALAENYLAGMGLVPVSRNYRCRQGEIDLIMRDGETLVFVEVRYRKSGHYGSALETVTATKQQKILIAAQLYIQEQKVDDTIPLRFDVIGITGDDIQWIKAAFD